MTFGSVSGAPFVSASFVNVVSFLLFYTLLHPFNFSRSTHFGALCSKSVKPLKYCSMLFTHWWTS